MKTGIFEMEHFECAYPMIRLFDMPGNQLVIFTDADTYERFADLFKQDMHRFQWEVLDKSRGRWRFFNQLYKAAGKHKLDLFCFNTISNNHLFYTWVIERLRVARVVITIHDINCMFKSSWSFKARPFFSHIGKKAIIKRVKEFNVISDTMVDYLRETTDGKKQVHNIPGAVFESEQVSLNIGDHIHLVVPGSLDKKRRDYSQVFALLKAAEAKQLPLHITLLGGYIDNYGKAVLEQVKSLSLQHARVTVYDTRLVLQDEFDKQLNAAHFIFIPSVIDTAICFSIPEVYGLTKSSGNMFDVIKHARPFIAPKALRVSATLESSCYRYTTIDHLSAFLQGILQNKEEYVLWQQRALDNSKEYTIDKVRGRNPTLFEC